MVTNKIKQIGILLFMLCWSVPSYSGITTQMNEMFDSMVNVTPTSAQFNNVMRGRLSGGGLVVKNKVIDPQIISFQTPSLETGCGGINFFGGSMSFINFKQFEQMLRTIASNALGYAFNVALSALCKTCAETMNELQKKIQAFNDQFGNSCEIAKNLAGMAGLPAPALIEKGYMDDVFKSASTGIGNIFKSLTFTSDVGSTSTNSQDDLKVAGKQDGPCRENNFIWCALKVSNTDSWFTGGDTLLLEQIMSVTGALIVKDKTARSQDASASTREETTGDDKNPTPMANPIVYLDPMLSFEDLLYGVKPGDTKKIYKCDTTATKDDCKSPGFQNIALKGMITMVEDMLLGTSSTPGILDKMSTNTGTLSAAEQSLMFTMRGSMGSLLTRMVVKSPSAAREFAKMMAPFVAFKMVNDLVRDVFEAVDRSKESVMNSPFYAKLLEAVDKARSKFYEDRKLVSSRVGTQQDLMSYFNNVMTASQSYDYRALAPVGRFGK